MKGMSKIHSVLRLNKIGFFKIPSKFLNVYDFGMKMFTSQPITALLAREAEL